MCFIIGGCSIKGGRDSHKLPNSSRAQCIQAESVQSRQDRQVS